MIKKRSLLIGASGLIGGKILKILNAQNENIILFSRHSINLESNIKALRKNGTGAKYEKFGHIPTRSD